MPIDPAKAQEAVAAKAEEIDAVDNDIMNVEVSVRQAIDELTKGLEGIEDCLGECKYEKAAGLGYTPLCTSFVFVQRTLGALNSAEMEKIGIIQDLARTLECAYEDISPYVDAKMKSTQPRHPVTQEDGARYLADMAKFRAQFGPDGEWLDNEDDDEPEEAAPRQFDFARAVGFGRQGYNKAIALQHATQSQGPARELMLQIPDEAYASIERESSRLGVFSSQLVQAAIAYWLDTNPKRARVSIEREPD